MEFLRRRLGLIFRTLVSVLAITWVVRTNNWSKVWENVLTMDVIWLVAAVACFIPTLLIVSWRWRMLLAVHDVHMRYWRTFELTMIGQFFSTVGVGTTGGDVFKIFYVARAVPQKKAAVAFTVVVDRVIGLVALLVFGSVFSFMKLPLLFSQHDTRSLTFTFYFFALGGVVASLVTCASPYLWQHQGLQTLLKRLPFVHKGAAIFTAFERSARAIGINVIALIGSIPSHMCILAMGYCILRAMHLYPDLLAFCAIMAIVNMLIALPVSISGMGVRETLFTLFFVLIGIDKAHAVAFSLTYFCLTILWCLMGAPFYFLYRHETHAPAPHVEEVDPIFSQQ